jgi:hemerythrin-like domain-containing protein
VLRDEHEVILRVLAALEVQLDRISGGAPPDAEALRDTLEFLRGFADKCHHGKEEDLLFPALEVAGLPREGGPVGVMMEEHVQGREYIRGMDEGVLGLAGDPARSRTRVLDNGWAYIQMLRAHIHKENEILFPLAERVLGADVLHGLTHRFEDVEVAMGPGTHEHYLALAAKLEAKAGLRG